jgi:prolyl 4-hydroxylase
MLNAKVIKNFISKEDCKYLIDLSNSLNVWENAGDPFWDNRVINYESVLKFDKNAASIMMNANIGCRNIIKNSYALNFDVYSDTLQIVRWFPGMEQGPHADDMTNSDVKGLDHRAFGSIIYLNDNYRGGHTYYPNFNKEVIPETGSLAIHPGDPEHLHGVTKVEDGMRYTIVSFWTFEKEKSREWPIPE